jgi:cytochrome c-type biogenesis protein CcsB
MIILFNISFGAYLAAAAFFVASLFLARRFVALSATTFMAGGIAVQTVYMAMRWVQAGRAPFSNMFESLFLFAWAIALVCLTLRARTRIPAFAAAGALLAALILAWASTFEKEIQPLVPALQSNWLSVHVFTCFLGYGGFAVSFLSAISYLIGSRAVAVSATGEVLNGAVPVSGGASAETLDLLEASTAKTISFGFLFLTVGIITGAVWANSAWGTYWSWDPKETWSLMTWLIYAAYLHCRYMRGWRGKREAWIAVVGFFAVLITYVGVNFWWKGLHSYAS